MSTRPLFVHIGASKTGTSSLQRGLWDSIPELNRVGIGVPYVDRPDHVENVLRPFGWVAGSGYVKPLRRRRFSDIVDRLKATRGDRLLMSNEDLCELQPRRIKVFRELADAAGCELHVVLTARDWSLQIPSEWQQFLKHRITTPYEDFLEQVRDHEGPVAEHYHRRQNLAQITERWGQDLPPGRVHVMSVPSSRQDPEGVFRMFAQIVGFEPGDLKRTPSGANASFGYVEAEVYRRLNQALGERLGNYESQYYPAVRIPLVSGVLPRQASSRITLPPEHVGWVREAGQDQLDTLRSRGYHLHGDPEGLVSPADSGQPLPELVESEVAAAAIATLASFAVRSFNRSR